ncbi:MAG: membrane protein [Myxococcales bacterium]
MTTLLVIALVGAALLGMPLFAVMFLGTALSYAAFSSPPIDLVNVFVVMGDLLDKPYLLPIPLFTFAGYLLANSGTPKRLVDLAEAWFGWLPGGLAIVAVLTCSFFTTFTGASGVTIIALGGLLYPVLLERKYPERFSLGLMTASGSLGLLFFPSLPIFLYATVYSLSTGGAAAVEPSDLFLGGLLPGIVMAGTLCGYALWTGARLRIARTPFTITNAMRALRAATGEVLLPVAILVLLQTGRIGINEIASITVVYVLILEVFVHRDVSLSRDLPRLVRESMVLVGAIILILALILGMNNFLTQAEIPSRILASLKEVISSRVAFLLALNVFLLVIGCLMDIFSATVAVVPLLIPLAQEFDVSPIHLGIIFLANLEIGYLTPPVGMNLFISHFQFRRPILSVYRSVVPFIGLLVFSLLVITYVPALSEWLPAQVASHAAESKEPGGPAVSPEQEQRTQELLDELSEDEDLEALYGDDEDGGERPSEEPEEPGDDELLEE